MPEVNSALVQALRNVSFWKRQRYRIEFLGLCLTSALICLLPWRWIRPLASLIGIIAFSIDRHRRHVTLANLHAVYGEVSTPSELYKIGRRSYMVFARTALELLWSPRLTKKVLDEIITTEGLEPIPPHAAPGKQAIYFTLHAGNFEWMNQITCRHFGYFPVIAQNMKNPFLQSLFNTWRSTLGQEVFPQKGATLRALRHLKKGGKIGLLIDLNLKPTASPVIIRCFNRFLTPVTRLPAELSLRTGAVLVPLACMPRPDGGYIARYLPEIPVRPESSVEEITQACWDALEPGLHAYPELWLWSYKHWRYRPQGILGKNYPFYANEYEPYQQLLKSCNLSS